MFRDTKKTPLSELNVGAGSVVSSGDNSSVKQRWLIVATDADHVALVSNETFEIESDVIEVQDPNFLSGDEARQLCSKISDKMQWTFTDFFFSTKGMKNVGFSNTNPQ